MRRFLPVASLLAVAACAPSGARDLERLCGTWQTVAADGTRTEERWWRDGSGLRGESRTFDPRGQVVASEQMSLGVADGGTVYHAEPRGQVPTDFREVVDPEVAPAPGERVWIWDNRAHDFPRRIVYRVGDDQLSATISDPDGDADRRRGLTWQLRRIAGC